MKKKLVRRVPAVVLATVILFSTVFALSISAKALTFTPRYSMPSTSNEYYYSSKNPFYPAGYGLPNCTAYAYGRVYEITGKRPDLSTGNAEGWYEYNKYWGSYDYGQKPRLGAIACWSYPGGGGHVAVVEYIDNATGEMILSNSAWSARYGTCEPFYLTYANIHDSNPGGSSWWNFQGYIYAVDSADVVIDPTESTTTPVIIIDDDETVPTSPDKKYDTGVYQVQVDDYLSMRSGSSMRYSYVTDVPDGAKLKVTAVKKNEDLTWGETSYDGWDGWVALNYCKYLGGMDIWDDETVPPVVPTEEPTEQPTTAPVPPTTEAPTEETTGPSTTQSPTESDHSKGLGVGDVNADGVINVLDVTLIQMAAAGIGDFTPEQLKWCDFDFDGKVTVNDATLVQKYVSGIYDYYL